MYQGMSIPGSNSPSLYLEVTIQMRSIPLAAIRPLSPVSRAVVPHPDAGPSVQYLEFYGIPLKMIDLRTPGLLSDGDAAPPWFLLAVLFQPSFAIAGPSTAGVIR
jgi:hypothetical protein